MIKFGCSRFKLHDRSDCDFICHFQSKVGGANESVDIVATYTNILTECMTSMIKSILGQSPG